MHCSIPTTHQEDVSHCVPTPSLPAWHNGDACICRPLREISAAHHYFQSCVKHPPNVSAVGGLTLNPICSLWFGDSFWPFYSWPLAREAKMMALPQHRNNSNSSFVFKFGTSNHQHFVMKCVSIHSLRDFPTDLNPSSKLVDVKT